MPIKKLSVQLANQIAAGEVVENPASVVKELLENAIDAHATVITLEIAEAGKLLIRVTDNGGGIPSDELPLALAPHATSKIHELKDLEAIVTLGFRGEALASIASVSKLSLISNTKQQDHGYKIEVEGPEQNPYIYPAAHPVGTTVIVSELFFNTPARRRFLKSDKTEFAKLKDIFNRIALVNYHCEFNLIVDGKNTLHLPVTNREGLPQRIAKLLGSDFKGPLIKLNNHDADFQSDMQQLYKDEHFSLEANPFPLPPVLGIHGVLLYPQIARRGLPDRLVFFLNGRCMGDKLVMRAVREAVMQTLKGGVDFKPSVRGVLFLECDPHIVDVNVHPRKDEVRFHDSSLIFDCIVTTIKTALKRYGLTAENFGQGELGLPREHEPDFDHSHEPKPPVAASVTSALDTPAAALAAPATPAAPAMGTADTAMSTVAPTSAGTAMSTAVPTTADSAARATAGTATAAAEEGLDSDGDDTEGEIDVKATVSLETGREVELRAQVEQYFARYPSAVRKSLENKASSNEADAGVDSSTQVDSAAPALKTSSLRGACCDFSRLQAGLAALTVLRQAQQAVSDFSNPAPRYGTGYGRAGDSLADRAAMQDKSTGAVGTAGAVGAIGTTGAIGSESIANSMAKSTAISTPASESHFDLNAMLWQQERQRNQGQNQGQSEGQNQGQSEARDIRAQTPVFNATNVTKPATNFAATPAMTAAATAGSAMVTSTTTTPAMTAAPNMMTGMGAIDSGVTGIGATGAGAGIAASDWGTTFGGQSYAAKGVDHEIGLGSEDSGRVIVDKARAFAQTMHMIQSSNSFASGAAGATASAVQGVAAQGAAMQGAGAALQSAAIQGAGTAMLGAAMQGAAASMHGCEGSFSAGLAGGAQAEATGAQFLALVAPNVVLFSLQQRYFLGKGSDLLIECVANDYAAKVQAQVVQSTELTVPFAILLDADLLQAFKRPDVVQAAQRCGFVLQVQLGRGVLELQRIPNHLVGCNLAAVVPALLPEIVHGADAINGCLLGVEGSVAPSVLCLKLARAREYEINTAYDARQLLEAIGSVQQIEPLLQHGTLHELNLLQLAQQMLKR